MVCCMLKEVSLNNITPVLSDDEFNSLVKAIENKFFTYFFIILIKTIIYYFKHIIIYVWRKLVKAVILLTEDKLKKDS